MILLHNHQCSKSNAALCFLNNAAAKFTLRDYLSNPLDEHEIASLLNLLGMKAIDIIRKKEALFLDNFANLSLDESGWIKVLAEHPQLLERPILIGDDFALIGRPPEVIEAYLQSLEAHPFPHLKPKNADKTE